MRSLHVTPERYQLLKDKLWGFRAILFEDGHCDDPQWFDRWLFPEIHGGRPALIFMLGQDGGVLAVHGIRAGRGEVQIFIWDRALLGRVADIRPLADNLFSYGLRRLDAFVPVFNRTCLEFANKIGFRKVGVISQEFRRSGRWIDVVAFELLPGRNYVSG